MEASGFDKAAYDLLVNTGVRYCYSKTVAYESHTYHTRIFLTPAPKRPNIRRLTAAFDTYFNINAEPKLMAGGIDEDTTVYLNPDYK